MASLDRLLTDAVEAATPASVLVLGLVPEIDAVGVCAARGIPCQTLADNGQLDQLADFCPCDLVLLGDLNGSVDRRSADILLAGLRDLHARRVIVRRSPDGPWTDKDLIAFGFRRLSPAGLEIPVYFGFDIATYKTTPDWLNPRNWANPELFDKYRW